MGFNVTAEENFTGMVSNSTLQLTFKKPSFVQCNIKGEHSQLSKKAIKIIVFQLHICVRLDFLHQLQPKQQITTDFIQKQIGECSWFLLSQRLKGFFKNVKQCHLFSKKIC